MPRAKGTPWKIDISGQRFSHWLVLERIAGSMWRCKCDCGGIYAVSGSSLKLGNSIQCKKCSPRKHGLEATKVYNAWAAMKQRCLNEKTRFYHLYGGRGIMVCDKWMKFDGFFEDMGVPKTNRHSLGRINNDGNYCKENCRWETPKQQIRNRSNTKFVIYDGEKKSLAEISEKFGHKAKLVRDRLKSGWSIEDALTKPKRK